MKIAVPLALCALLIAGCSNNQANKRVDDLKAQVDDLTQRVKTLEDDVLKADKQLIQQQQAMQQMHDDMRNIETYFDKMQAGQTAVPH